jgi:hypothetical protein
MATFAGVLSHSVPFALKQRLSRIVVDVGGDHRSTIFVGGTGRSGTTWLANLVNHDGSYREMYEPFHSYFVAAARKFRYALYLRPTDKNPQFIEPARRILSGRVSNQHIDEGNRRIFYRRRIAKEVRCNLWLKWLHANFRGMPIVLIIRHPCAVASSRMLLDWPTRLSMFLEQPELIEDHLAPFRDAVAELNTPFERHIFTWCIQHYVPLRQFRQGEINVVFYERLCSQPKAELATLPFMQPAAEYGAIESRIAAPSPTSRRHSAIASAANNNLIDAWRKHITAAQIKRAVEILTLFNLHRLYGEDSMPNACGLQDVLAPAQAETGTNALRG